MLGELAVGYLFLGGTGAGAIAVASVLDLALVRAPFGTDARVSADEAPPCERVVAFALLAGFAALALGVLCLLFDLGRIDRALDLFLRPSPTYLTVGSFALAALVACGAFLALVRFAYLPFAPRAAVVAVEAVAVAVGLVVVVYTGLLLQGLGAVALWRSPFVPLLFALSSLSCGIAVVLAAAFFADQDGDAGRIVRLLVRADAAIIVLEAVAAALFAGLALASDHPGAAGVSGPAGERRRGAGMVGRFRGVRPGGAPGRRAGARCSRPCSGAGAGPAAGPSGGPRRGGGARTGGRARHARGHRGRGHAPQLGA